MTEINKSEWKYDFKSAICLPFIIIKDTSLGNSQKGKLWFLFLKLKDFGELQPISKFKWTKVLVCYAFKKLWGVVPIKLFFLTPEKFLLYQTDYILWTHWGRGRLTVHSVAIWANTPKNTSVWKKYHQCKLVISSFIQQQSVSALCLSFGISISLVMIHASSANSFEHP